MVQRRCTSRAAAGKLGAHGDGGKPFGVHQALSGVGGRGCGGIAVAQPVRQFRDLQGLRRRGEELAVRVEELVAQRLTTPITFSTGTGPLCEESLAASR